MKSIISILMLLPLFGHAQGKSAEQLSNEGLKKYSLEKGQIAYEITGDATGKEVMIFNQNGWSSVRKQTMTFELYGIESTQTIYEVTDGDFIYRLNAEDSTFMKRQDLKWSQHSSYKTPAEASLAILSALGGRQTSEGKVLDKSCEIWTFENKALQELWVWNGLVLKRKLKLGNRLVESTATQINLDFNPEPTLFAIPGFYQQKN